MNVEAILKTKAAIPLRQRTILHLILVNNHIGDRIAQALKPFEVSNQQFNVLRILRGQKGEAANLSTLNERMVSRMSNTTRLVDKLIAKGYVSRNVCPENRRKVEIFITEAGMKALSEMDRAVATAENSLMAPFTDEQLKELNHLLDLVNE